MKNVLFVLCLLFVFSCTEKSISIKSIEIDYILPVGITHEETRIRYLGMPTASTFAIDRFPGWNSAVPIYYPIGIDTIFDGCCENCKAYLVKEVTPKYLKVHRFK